ncbi:MAG TPA: YraN family protein [Anaerolineae bacterium]|jgi:putative endonuclease|nr:YraN family protein [Anaerolineae bacterium]
MVLGKSGEDMAVRYLRRKRYRILARNFRSKLGEIDIVAQHVRTLVFCEVKLRLNEAFGQPFEAVTPHKQRRIRKVAELYMAIAVNPGEFDAVRFDVISILADGASFNINHIENAF